MDGARLAMQQARPVQFAENRDHAAGAVHVFHVVFLSGRSDFTQVRHPARQAVDVVHGKIHPAFSRRRQQVQHRIGGTAHGDIEAHGVFESLEAGDGARQDRSVAPLVITPGQFDDAPARL